MRLEDPLALAVFLLDPAPEWSEANLERALASKQTRTVALPEPVPVHLLYKTAWVDEAGTVHFRKDLYDRDAALIDALAAPPSRLRGRGR